MNTDRSEFDVSYLPVLDAHLGFESDIGFSDERTFMVGPGTDMIFKRIEPGLFRMSDVAGDRFMLGLRERSIDEPFWMSRYETTEGVFAAVMKTEVSDSSTYHHPVRVTFAEANEFCRKLTETEQAAGRIPKDMVFGLPTECQWEYALLAGEDIQQLRLMSNRKYICSALDTKSATDTLEKMGWFVWNDLGKTHAVGQKDPNAWGLYDMAGGVFEMCLDTSSAEQSLAGEEDCVVRGSRFLYTERMPYYPDIRAGFRVCLWQKKNWAKNRIWVADNHIEVL